MKLQFFTIRTIGDAGAVDELNRFLSTHRITALDRQFVADGGNSHWSVCVSYDTVESHAKPSKRSRIDYRDVLGEKEFDLFAQLRSMRKSIADEEGSPVYAVCKNEQLAAMIRQRVTSKEAFGAIEGIGPARTEKYADRFLAVLKQHVAGLDTSVADETNESRTQ